MISVARETDQTHGNCSGHDGNPAMDGTIRPCSQSAVLVNGLKCARIGDIVTASCGHTGVITTGASKVYVQGILVATYGSLFTGTYYGSVIGGSSTVLVE